MCTGSGRYSWFGDQRGSANITTQHAMRDIVDQIADAVRSLSLFHF